MTTSRRRRGFERARHFFRAVALDDVADLDVVVVLDADAALESFANFADVVLEALEGRNGAVERFDAVANDPHAALPIDHTTADCAARDRSDTRDLEYLAHLGFAQNDLPLLGAKHAFHCGTDVGDRLVNDAVQLDIHAFTFGSAPGVVVRTNVEADDDRTRRLREQDVALGDRANTAVDDFDLHLARRQAAERVGERLGGTALVRLDENIQRVGDAGRGLRHEVFERDAAARAATTLCFAIETLATLRHFTCSGSIFDNEELIAGHGDPLEAEDLHWNRGAGFLHLLATLVEQRANATRVHAADEVVTDAERAVLHEHRRDRSLARIELRFDHRSLRTATRVRLEIEDFGLK